MFCGKCGTKVNDSDKYCMNSGSRLGNTVEPYNHSVQENKIDKYKSNYNPTNVNSYIYLILSIITVGLSLLPLHQIYMLVIIGISVAVLVVSIIKYKKMKDRVLFISILLSCAALYTSLGWLYYLIVK